MNEYEICEALAEFENRISFLENSQPYRNEKLVEEKPIVRKPEVLIGTGEFRHLERKVNEILDARKKRRSYKYE